MNIDNGFCEHGMAIDGQIDCPKCYEKIAGQTIGGRFTGSPRATTVFGNQQLTASQHIAKALEHVQQAKRILDTVK